MLTIFIKGYSDVVVNMKPTYLNQQVLLCVTLQL